MPRKVQMQEQAPLSVQEAIASFLTSPEVKSLEKSTQLEYKLELSRFADWAATLHLTVDQVNNRVVDSFLDYTKNTRKPRKIGQTELSTYTLASQVRVIRTWLYWCLQDEEYSQYVRADVVRRIKKPKVIEVIVETFSAEQIASLRMACAKEESPHLRLRDEAIVLCLLDSGLRAAELCKLTIAHVDLSPADPHIRVLGKGSKWGEVGLGTETRKLMSQYLRKFRMPTLEAEIKAQEKKVLERHLHRLERNLKETQPFFMNRNGEHLTPSGLGRMIGRLGEWAEIEGVRCSPHTFRHTFASMFIRNGGDIYTLSKLLRHSSVKVTEEYLKSIRQWEARYHAQSVVDHL